MIYDTNNELDRNRLFSHLDNLLSKKCMVELKEKKKARTISQNAYLHVCISLFAIESGNHLEDMKYILKKACPFMHTFDGDNIKTRKTRDMNTQEIADFIEWIRNFFSMQGYGYMPTADEYKQNQFSIDKEIEKNKHFL